MSTLMAKALEITPEVIREHGITEEEYQKILKHLGRTPTITELGIFSVMWSEHCSYKSSRVHLKRDRKSTRLNSSHVRISYAVFCLKKKKTRQQDVYLPVA